MTFYFLCDERSGHFEEELLGNDLRDRHNTFVYDSFDKEKRK